MTPLQMTILIVLFNVVYLWKFLFAWFRYIDVNDLSIHDYRLLSYCSDITAPIRSVRDSYIEYRKLL